VTAALATAWSTAWTAITVAYLAAAMVWYVIDRRRPHEDRKFTPLANAVLIAYAIVLVFAVVLAVAA
jgi:Ni,Fe-hydrogenase I cytochrome b subunit